MDDDTTLLERDAVAQLYSRHADRIIRFFRTKVPEQVVEDHVQETFARLFEATERIRDGNAIRAYVLGIARNVLCEYLRGLKLERRLDLERDTIAGLQPGFMTLLGRQQQHRLLVRALRSLPIADQIRLELHYFEGMSQLELADFEQVPYSTMRSRMHCARQLLESAVASIGESAELVNSTIERLDDWARDIQCLIDREDEGEDNEPE